MPLKILHVVGSLEPGGMENVLLRYSERLSDRGVEMGYCCLAEAGEMAPRFETERIWALGKKPGLEFGLIGKIRQVVKSYGPAVVHTHNLGPLTYTAPALLGMDVPLLHGVHAQLLPQDFGWKRRTLRKLLYRRCQQIHTVSRAGMDELLREKLLPPAKLTAIVNGVDAAAFAPGDQVAARRELGLPEDGRMLGIVGRFRRTKRHLELIQAMAHLEASVSLMIVGDGFERPNLDFQVL